MSERSIAEIMGWERAADYDEERWVDPIDHVAWLPGSGYDCDDMLAWLVARDEHDGIETWSDQGGHVVKLWLSMQSWPDEHHAPTLHAALEAAVRAVAGATSSSTPTTGAGDE